MQKNFFIIISGPTGVGKTDFVDRLAARLSRPVEIFNADVGQFYEPLSIGTAKPDYKNAPIKQHLFDVISEPRDFTVLEFRDRLVTVMRDMWARGVTPLVVGGSGFYLQSLFFPPHVPDAAISESVTELCELSVSSSAYESTTAKSPSKLRNLSAAELWHHLNELDPERAQSIHPHDRYRIERALIVWYEGRKPSQLVPQFDPPGTCAFFFLTRERDELYARINERVDAMLAAGWIDEVKNLDPSWKEFLLKKKLIGYPELIMFIEHAQNLSAARYEAELKEVAMHIKSKTRAYAKRQLTFWRMLRKKLEGNDPKGAYLKKISEVNLTILPLDLYIEEMGREFDDLIGLP